MNNTIDASETFRKIRMGLAIDAARAALQEAEGQGLLTATAWLHAAKAARQFVDHDEAVDIATRLLGVKTGDEGSVEQTEQRRRDEDDK